MTPVWNFTGSVYWINPRTYKWGGNFATPMRFFDIFPGRWNISTWRFQWLFIYPSGAFRDKSSDGPLLWLRDMTSYVAGVQAIFEWKWWVFLTFFNNKNNLWMKWYKVRIHVLLYMSSTKNNHLSRFYVTYFLILGKIQDCGQDGGGSAWITSNLLVRSPQPKRLDSSILFSLVKLVFRLLASIYR